MSLVGNIEDLGLGDILQIVSLSRKSGILNITSGDKDGGIVFRNGQVIRAFSTDVEENVESCLVGSGVIDKEVVADVLKAYNEKGTDGSLDSILIEKFDATQDSIDNIKREQIEKSVYSLFLWATGHFDFELKDVEEYVGGKGEISDLFIYDHGLNPQFLAMEGTRLQDESKRDQEEKGEEPEEVPEVPKEAAPQLEEKEIETEPEHLWPTEPEEAEEHIKALHEEVTEESSQEAPVEESVESLAEQFEAVGKGVVIIDDDENTLESIKEGLKERGFDVFIQNKTEKALYIVSELKSQGSTVTVISDLIMPRMDGTGILGGIETLELLRGGFPDVPVILMTDHVNREAEKNAKDMGVFSYIDKPKRAQFGAEYDSVAIDSFLDQLEGILSLIFERAEKEEEPSGLIDFAADLREEFEAVGNILPEESGSPPPPSSRGISMLKSMIEELNSPEGGKQITLLTLRFASELMNRSVIFLAKSDSFEGLGQFGIEIEGEIADKRIRSMKLSLDKPSILKEVVETQRSVKKRMEETEGNRYIIDNLGGSHPFESYAAPIIANGRVAVILYCDNIPQESEIGDTSALEIFLMQAGITMERALLERRLQEMSV